MVIRSYEGASEDVEYVRATGELSSVLCLNDCRKQGGFETKRSLDPRCYGWKKVIKLSKQTCSTNTRSCRADNRT